MPAKRYRLHLLILACLVLALLTILGIGLWRHSHSTHNAHQLDISLTPQGEPLGRVYFESGKSTLPPEAGGALYTVHERAMAAPDTVVLIAGFHDPSGDPVQNKALALARANAAREALIALGVPAERIHLAEPAEIDGADRQEARRVDMRVQ